MGYTKTILSPNSTQRLIRFSLALLFLSGLASGYAQNYPGRLATLGNEDPSIADALNAKCSSDDDGETLDCTLTTTSVDYALAPEDKSARVDEFFLHAKLAGSLDVSINSLFDTEQCASIFEGKIDSADSARASQYRNQLNQLCSAEPNETNARRLLELQAEIESQTCKVWGSSGGITFSRVGPAKWGLQTEPEGSCDVYEIFELSCDSENMYYCEYDEHAVYGKKTGEYCEGFQDVVDEGDHYSSEVTMNFEMQCSFIQFTY